METTTDKIEGGSLALQNPGPDRTREETPGLQAVIERVRRRWRLRRLLVGTTWILATGAALIALAAYLLDVWHFAPPLVTSLRLALLLAALGLIYRFFVVPLRQQVAAAGVARIDCADNDTLQSRFVLLEVKRNPRVADLLA